MRKSQFEFSQVVRRKIKDRDNHQCIFCSMYGNSGFDATQIMHFVPRSHLGLGIEENGALGCVVHHQQLDNSAMRKTMLKDFEYYLRNHYPNWNKEKLVYTKWRNTYEEL